MAIIPILINGLEDRWTNVNTIYTAISMNVTNSASAAGSMLLNLAVNDISKFKVVSNGSVGINLDETVPSASLHIASTANNQRILYSTGYSLSGSNSVPMADFSGTWNTTRNSYCPKTKCNRYK